MIRYGAFHNFIWLWLVIAVAALLTYGLWRRRRVIDAFVGTSSGWRLLDDISWGKSWAKMACVVAAVALLVVALTQPQWGTYWTPTRSSGRDILVAIDVSRSMLAEDVTPSRLERAKADVRDLIAAVEESGGHRLGIIAFAGAANVKCPLTQVTSHVKLVLDGLSPRSVAQGGTLIGDAIRTAIAAFDDKTQNFRDFILITDGEDMDSYPLEAAAAARDAGVTIYAIGLGDSAEGARVPVADKSGRRSFLEHNGEVVWSKLDEKTLKQVAEITDGLYVPAGTRAIELDRIFREVIEPKSKREMDETRRERLHHRFQWFLAPAVLLLIMERLMRDTRRRPELDRDASRTGAEPTNDRAVSDAVGSARRRPASARVRHSVLPMFVAGAAIGSLGFAEDAASLVRDGNRLYEAGKFADAAARYEQAASLDPESPVPLFNRAAALFQMGDFAAAAQLYEQARARAPESLRQKINFALGNSRLQQAIAQPTTPQAASQSAKEAASFYRDAIVSPPATASAADKTATNELSDAARFNLEIAKRLIKQLQAQQKQQPQDQSQHQNDDIKDRQDQQQPDTQGQSALRNEQPAPDKSDQQAQPAPDATEEQTQARGGAANQPFSPEDAAERLRSAIARAQMARSRRLTEEAKQAKAKAVEKDW